MRAINDILFFRGDISPFLVHLTRSVLGGPDAATVLNTILSSGSLRPGETLVSDARFGMNTYPLSPNERKRYFGAICFTETPLSEVHCLLEVAYRQINLEPYGLVFLKEKLQQRSVSPVFYLNNEVGDKGPVVQAFCSLIQSAPAAAEEFLPLVSVFGNKLTSPGAAPQTGQVDFRWEREWRYPYAKGAFEFTSDDIFVGLCPDDRITYFEQTFKPMLFIDPTRPTKWYATKLIEARQRADIKYSVV